MEGAAGGAASQGSKEICSVFFLHKPINLKDSAGRIFIATGLGAGFGGIAFKIEPFITQTINPSIKTVQGFTQVLPWAEMTVEKLSISGASAAAAVEGSKSATEKLLEDNFNLDDE